MDNDDQNNPAPKYDPAGETKQKIIFAVVTIIILVGLKYIIGI